MKKTYILLLFSTLLLIFLGVFVYNKYVSLALKAFEDKILTEIDSVGKTTRTPTPVLNANCKFDINSQTDAFLKNKTDFSNYTWDEDKKTAQVQLNENTQLLIERGGCNQFNFYLTLKFEKSNLTVDNKKEIFQEILPFAQQLFEIEDYNLLNLAIMTGDYEIHQYKNEFLMDFYNEKHCNANLYFHKSEKGQTTIKLGFTLC